MSVKKRHPFEFSDNDVAELRAKGWGVKRIAQHFGISRDRMRLILKTMHDNGVIVLGRLRAKPFTLDEDATIRQMYIDGYRDHEIAAALPGRTLVSVKRRRTVLRTVSKPGSSQRERTPPPPDLSALLGPEEITRAVAIEYAQRNRIAPTMAAINEFRLSQGLPAWTIRRAAA